MLPKQALSPCANMLRNLHVTDLTPASGETYHYNRQWCAEQGACIHPQPVSLFDYKHMLGDDAPPFDLIVGFGLCLNVFADEGTSLCSGQSNSTVARQYRYLAHSDLTHQQLFNEALLGQSVNSTQILIHQVNHAIVSPTPLSYAFAKVRMYNPNGLRHLSMRMGAQMTESTAPLVCNVSGPGALDVLTHVRNTMHCEQQLDVQSAILRTLAPRERGAAGKVLVLGAGDLRFLRKLGHAEPLDSGRPVRQPGHVGVYGKHFKGHMGYFDYVLTRPFGTTDPNESAVGRVNLQRLLQWCENYQSTFEA